MQKGEKQYEWSDCVTCVSKTDMLKCAAGAGEKGGFLGIIIRLSFRWLAGLGILPPHKVVNDGRPRLQYTTTV